MLIDPLTIKDDRVPMDVMFGCVAVVMVPRTVDASSTAPRIAPVTVSDRSVPTFVILG